MRALTLACIGSLFVSTIHADVPANLTAENIPSFSPKLRADAARYMEFRSASFGGWHPERREILISTRFADTAQLHSVKMPGGDRKQITFGSEPIRGGAWQPKAGKCILYAQDTGGGEFYQIYRLDLDGRSTLLTDGKSRNGSAKWTRAGTRFAYTSTRRNGKDTDIYVQDPFDPASAKLVMEVPSGGWSVMDWSRDEKRLLLGEYISANESRIHVLDLTTGKAERLTPDDGEKVAWNSAQFTADEKCVFALTDRKSEFNHLVQIDLAKREVCAPKIEEAGAEIEEFEISPDGKLLAYLVNREGAS